jgi:CTP:phosphocholine cytidylyltransferase-like protein
MRNHIEQKEKAKDAALVDFMENGMELVNKKFNMMADSEMHDLERTRKIEFEEKVAKCVQAIETMDNQTIDMMFEPKVIIKVTDKVYGKIMSQTDKTIDSLNLMIKKLETHQLGEFNSLEELRDLAYNLEMFRP